MPSISSSVPFIVTRAPSARATEIALSLSPQAEYPLRRDTPLASAAATIALCAKLFEDGMGRPEASTKWKLP